MFGNSSAAGGLLAIDYCSSLLSMRLHCYDHRQTCETSITGIFTQITFPMDLNAFPDTVLRAVFGRVSLLDLARHIPLVCHRWHSLQTSALLGKKDIALTIFVKVPPGPRTELSECGVAIPFAGELTNEDGSRMYPSPMDDPRRALTISLSTFTSGRVDALIGKLGGNVIYLKMVFKSEPRVSRTIPLVIRLLNHWGPKLKTLKFHCQFRDAWKRPEMGRLIETVNTKLPLLEHLTLDLYDGDGMAQPLDLPVLGQLKEFFFSTGFGQLDYLFPSLKRYAEPNDQLRAIGVGNYGCIDKFLDVFAESSLRSRFTFIPNIEVPTMPYNPLQHERFMRTFTEQTKMKFDMTDPVINMVQLTNILAPLHNLVYLTLWPSRFLTRYDLDPVDQIRPLPSVKILHLVLNTSSHNELISRHFGRMFPKVQIIVLYHSARSCSLCDTHVRYSDPEKVASCEQQTLQTFKQQFGTSLKKVYYCLNDKHNKIKVY